MPKTIERKPGLDEIIPITLPFGLGLSNVRNIEYCIGQLGSHFSKINNPVVGYYVETGWGRREVCFSVLPKEKAEELKSQDSDYRYRTLDDLLKKIKEVERGKYKVHNSLIVGLNPSYIGK